MGRLTPIVPPGENEPVELRVKPKVCEACGGKFIPVKGWTKYCPFCRRLPQKQREAMRDARALHPEEEKDSVMVYVDENLKKKEKEMGKVKTNGPFEDVPQVTMCEEDFAPLTVTVTPEEIAEEVADQVSVEPAQSEPEAPKPDLAALLSEQLGAEVLPFDAVEDVEIYVGTNRIFRGYAIGRAPK